MNDEVPIISEQWVDAGCEAAYRQCMEQIAEIQKAAREAAEPWIRRATHWHSIGTRPIYVTMVKDVSPRSPARWDGTITLEQATTINGVEYPAGKYSAQRVARS